MLKTAWPWVPNLCYQSMKITLIYFNTSFNILKIHAKKHINNNNCINNYIHGLTDVQ